MLVASFRNPPLTCTNKNGKNIFFCYLTVKPRETSIRFSQNPVKLGDSFTIKCESRGFPEPSYAITLNGTTTVSAEKTYTIQKVMWNDTGTYECTATNTRGSDLVSALLDVTSKLKVNAL